MLLPMLRAGTLGGLIPMAEPKKVHAKKEEEEEMGDALVEVGVTASAGKEVPGQKHAKQPGWSVVKPKPKKEEAGGDILQPEGFNAAVCSGVAELSAKESKVCLATKQETERALKEIIPSVPVAVLSTARVKEEAEEVQVYVKNKEGLLVARKRFMHQLGPRPVIYAPPGQKGGQVTDTSVRMCLGFTQKQSGTKVWQEATARPKHKVAQWLRETAEVKEILDIFPPSMLDGERKCVSTVVVIRKEDRAKVLKKSGEQGCFSRPWYPKKDPSMEVEEEKEFCTVPLPLEQNLESSLRTAASLGNDCFGVVPCGPGFGVRVPTAKQVEITRQIRPEDAPLILGKSYEVRGIPLSWGKEELKAFLKGWEITPVFGKRHGFSRTWSVKAAKAPFATKLQHDYGLAVIAEKPAATKGEEARRWTARRATASASPTSRENANAQGARMEHQQGKLAPAAATESVTQSPATPTPLSEDVVTKLMTDILTAIENAVAPLKREIAAMKAVQEVTDSGELLNEDDDAMGGMVATKRTRREIERG